MIQRRRHWMTLAVSLLIGTLLLFGKAALPGAAASEIAITGTAAVPVATETVAVSTEPVQLATDNTQLSLGWQQTDTGRSYRLADGSYAVGVQEIDGIPYLFDYTGRQKTGWRSVNGVRMYYDPDTGEAVTGWILYHGSRYYVGENGKETGEIQTADGSRYLLDTETGAQQTGFCTFSDGTMSYYDANGTLQNGWIETERGRCYSENGVIQTGWITLDGVRYCFRSNGSVYTGWQILENQRYYFDSNGAACTGWMTLDKHRYYFDETGAACTGWKTISGVKYYFNNNGTLLTGWLKQNGKRYYLASDGSMCTGWQTIGGARYYFDPSSGVACTGWLTLNGDTYYFTESGCITGKATIQGKTYYFGSTGCMAPAIIAWQQQTGSAEAQRTKYLTGFRRWDNYVWTVCGDTSQTISNSACGIFALINSIYYKTGTFLDPITVADWAKSNGYRTASAGVDVEFFQAYTNAISSTYGVKFAGRMYTVDAALQHVRNGGTICANIPGHWIAVVDYDATTGKYLLLDSAAACTRCSTINWSDTGVAWVSASEFTQNSSYRFFVNNRRVYAFSY